MASKRKAPSSPLKPGPRRNKVTKRKQPVTDSDIGTLLTESTTDLPAEDTTPQEKLKTMPSRLKKNNHPGVVARGQTRRTSAQVAVEKAHKEEARKKAEVEEAANLQALAQLNVEDDRHRALQKTRAIRRISDIPEEVYESEGEFIPLGGDDSDSSMENGRVESDSEEGDDEIEIRGRAKAAAAKRVVTKATTSKTKQVSESRNSTKAQLAEIEDGLKTKVSQRVTSKSGRRAQASGYDPTWLKKTNAKNLKDNTLVIGGLTNDDIYDERPDPSNYQTSGWDKLRPNKDVALVRCSEPPAGTSTIKGAKKVKPDISKVKLEPKADSGDEVGPASVLVKLTTKTVRTHHLPEFTHNDTCWTTKLLPTAYYWLFVSNAPFDEFSLSSPELPGIIQELIQLIYGKDAGKYTVKGRHDPILLTVYNRCNSIRNLIGKLGTNIVEHNITDLSAVESQRWLLHAKRPDGPLFWEIPCPEGCPISPKADGYQQPTGRMKSRFIMDAAKAALSHTQGTVTDFGRRPVGLFTLIAVALERAVKIASGEKKMDFSGDKLESRVVFYNNKLVSKIKEDRWDEVLSECRDHDMDCIESGDEAGDVSMLDHVAGDVFDLESPAKIK